MGKKTFILRHPIFSYFGLAFIIVWVGSYIVVGSKFSPDIVMQFDDIWPIVLMMFLTPSLVGISLTYIVDGKIGLRDLLARMRRWRIGGAGMQRC